MKNVDLKGKRVFIREDLNVPMRDGEITSDLRIHAALPTIEQALKAGAKVMLLSHLGRPTPGEFQEELSLAPIAKRLGELLKREIPLVRDWLKGVDMAPGDIVMCENTRFNLGEKENNEALAKKMAALCDVYVMDAFATAHRAEVSTCGAVRHAPMACAGPLLMAELNALHQALEKPKHPIVAIVGGSKVSTKVKVLESLLEKADTLIVGGGIANTFIAAAGHEIGGSLYEEDFLDEAGDLLELAKKDGKNIPLPDDVVVADDLSDKATAYTQPVMDVAQTEKIFDIGPNTAQHLAAIIKEAGTVLWNGPVGVFEIAQFSQGTQVVAEAIADSTAFSIAGGGDTLAAIEKYGVADKISYISTGGGAFLAYLEGATLPALEALEENQQQRNA